MQTNSSVFLGDQYYNKQHLDFILFKVLKADSLTAFDYFSEHDKDAIKMYLEATDQFAKEYLFPYLVEMDRKQPELSQEREAPLRRRGTYFALS